MKQYLIKVYTWVWANSEQEAVDKLADVIVIVKIEKVEEVSSLGSIKV